MRTLVVIVSLLFSTSLAAEWTWVANNIDKSSFYVAFKKVKEVDGYLYAWLLGNHVSPDKFGFFSYASYHQVDCELQRSKTLTEIRYKQPMARGFAGDRHTAKNPQWFDAPPDSVIKVVSNMICSLASGDKSEKSVKCC